MDTDPKTLAEKYFLHWKSGDQSLFWAWDAVTNIMMYQPEAAWPIILELVRSAPSKEALAYVGAGPIEDFLAKHGELVADNLVDWSRQDGRLKEALVSVWGRNRIPTRVLGILDRIAGRPVSKA